MGRGGGGGVPPTFYFIFTFREPTGPDGSKRHTLRDWEYVTPGGAPRKPISGGRGRSARSEPSRHSFEKKIGRPRR